MNINWKARLTSKTFWVAIVSAIVLLTQQLGYNIFPSNWSDILNTVLTIFIILGIVVDPSTKGISDQVMAESNTTAVNNTISEKSQDSSTNISASSKIVVDNPDNVQAIGATVNHTSATISQ